jgi:hypothetical protein
MTAGLLSERAQNQKFMPLFSSPGKINRIIGHPPPMRTSKQQ